MDIQWHLSSGRHSRLYSSARSDDNGSYIQLYHQISREMDKASSWAIGYDRGIQQGDWTTGRMSFVSTASAFDNYVFDTERFFRDSALEHHDHEQILFSLRDLKLGE